uniref:Uncharacterized protein n=1 Tax=viral metagenome TaxID=1070528 RepID=A0A6C0BM68_9ZZZZ
MSSEIPVCRKYPWLFKTLECDSSSSSDDSCGCKICSEYLRQQSIMGCMNPFRDNNVTADDVTTLIGQGYQLASQDVLDIELNVHMDEIFKLYHQGVIVVYPSTLKLNNSYSLRHHQLIQDEYAKVNNGLLVSPWDLNDINQNIDVTQIIKHPEVGWIASLLSLNPSVCLEHIPQIKIDETGGGWDYSEMLGRSDPNLALNILRDNTSCVCILQVPRESRDNMCVCVLGISRNPRMSVDNIIDLLKINNCQRIIDNILRYSHPKVIIDCINRGIIDDTRSCMIWMNDRLTEEWKNELSKILGYEPSIYYGSKLDIFRDCWMELSDEEQDILIHHPRALEIIPFHELMEYNDDVIYEADLDLLLDVYDQLKTRHIVRVLERDDLTSEFIEQFLDPDVLMDIRSARMVHPDQLMHISEELSGHLLGILSTCRYLDLDRLHEYIDEEELPAIASRDDILNGLVDLSSTWTNPRLSYELIMELLDQGKITYGDLEEHWFDYVHSYDRSSEIVKFKGTFPELVDDETFNGAMEKIRASSLESILRFNDPITQPFNNHDACELIEPYYFKREDILSHNGLSMYVEGERLHRVMEGLPARFKVLLSLGHLKCVRNCFKPMTFSDRSIVKYSDIEIITV